MKDLVELNDDLLKSCLSSYTDLGLANEYNIIQSNYLLLDTLSYDSLVYEYLDKLEPLIMNEIITRFLNRSQS